MFLFVDQVSFKILIFIYSFLIGNGLPVHEDIDWEVINHWEPQSDNLYLLTLESRTIAEKCKQNPKAHIVFPSVNLSVNSIMIDGKLHETNKLQDDLILSEVFYKPVLPCTVAKDAKLVRQEIRSYVQYMGAIKSYPKMILPSIGFYLLNSDLFFIATLFVILITFLSSAISLTSGWSKRHGYGLILNLLVLVVLLFISPGKFFEISMIYTNELFLPVLVLSIYMIGYFANILSLKKTLLTVLIAVVIYILSIGSKNTIQLLSLLAFPFILLWIVHVIYIYYRQYRSEMLDIGLFRIQIVVMCLVVVAAVYDGFVSRLTFNYFVFLPFAYVMVSISNFIEILHTINLQRHSNFKLRSEMQIQSKYIANLVGNNEKYLEILHDIKSPLTGLNFFLSKDANRDQESLKLINSRFRDLLKRSENVLFESKGSWVDADVLVARIKDAVRLYQDQILISVEIKRTGSKEFIFCNETEFNSIVIELLDNSIKAGTVSAEILIFIEDKFRLVYKNGIVQSRAKVTRDKSTGRGLQFIRNRIQAWNGKFETAENFDSSMVLLVKQD